MLAKVIHPLSCPGLLQHSHPTEVVCIWFRTRAAASHPPSSSVFGLACSAWLALCPHCFTSPMETLLKSRSGQEVGGQESFLCTTPKDLERDSGIRGDETPAWQGWDPRSSWKVSMSSFQWLRVGPAAQGGQNLLV